MFETEVCGSRVLTRGATWHHVATGGRGAFSKLLLGAGEGRVLLAHGRFGTGTIMAEWIRSSGERGQFFTGFGRVKKFLEDQQRTVENNRQISLSYTCDKKYIDQLMTHIILFGSSTHNFFPFCAYVYITNRHSWLYSFQILFLQKNLTRFFMILKFSQASFYRLTELKKDSDQNCKTDVYSFFQAMYIYRLQLTRIHLDDER